MSPVSSDVAKSFIRRWVIKMELRLTPWASKISRDSDSLNDSKDKPKADKSSELRGCEVTQMTKKRLCLWRGCNGSIIRRMNEVFLSSARLVL